MHCAAFNSGIVSKVAVDSRIEINQFMDLFRLRIQKPSGEPLVPLVPLCPEVTTKAVQSSWLPFSRARFTRALGQKGYATDCNRPSK